VSEPCGCASHLKKQHEQSFIVYGVPHFFFFKMFLFSLLVPFYICGMTSKLWS